MTAQPSITAGMAPAPWVVSTGSCPSSGFLLPKGSWGHVLEPRWNQKSWWQWLLALKVCAHSHAVQHHLRVHSSSPKWWETSKEKEQSKKKQDLGREELLLWIKEARRENHHTETRCESLQQELWLFGYIWTLGGRHSCRHSVSEAWHILYLQY